MKQAVCCVAIILLAGTSLAADEKAEIGAIRQRVDTYVAAFNRGDAKAVAALWSDNAVYISPHSGEKRTGRAAIQASFAELFAADNQLRLSVDVDSVRLISADVAMEEGTATFLSSDGPPSTSQYTVIHVKRDDQWYIDSVRETILPSPASHYEQLKELAWMIGEWIDADDNASVQTTCSWTKNKNFIQRRFSISVQDRIDLEGIQVIGWDPAERTIRSWVFDTDGGFGQGVWTRDGNRWVIRARGTLADGALASSVRIVTYLDENTFTVQAVGREHDGQLLPNIDEFKVVRVASEQVTSELHAADSKAESTVGEGEPAELPGPRRDVDSGDEP